MSPDARASSTAYEARTRRREAVSLHDRLLAWLLNDPAIVRTAGIPNCIGVPELASILRISARSAYQRIREGRLPGIQPVPNGSVVVPIPMLIKYLAGEPWASPEFLAMAVGEKAPSRRASGPAVRRRARRRAS